MNIKKDKLKNILYDYRGINNHNENKRLDILKLVSNNQVLIEYFYWNKALIKSLDIFYREQNKLNKTTIFLIFRKTQN